MKALHERFSWGNVVRWRGRLWIVADVIDNPVKQRLELIAFDASGVRAGPSDTWPTRRVFACGHDDQHHEDHGSEHCPTSDEPDPKSTVDTVEFVAATVRTFIKDRLNRMMYG